MAVPVVTDPPVKGFVGGRSVAVPGLVIGGVREARGGVAVPKVGIGF